MLPPIELSKLFSEEHFHNYPMVTIPQSFSDTRGTILNIADGVLGDVAYITSNKNAIRGNHYHQEDWHLSFLISGKMTYCWKDPQNTLVESRTILPGELFYTPPRTLHRMIFEEDSEFIAISKLNRNHFKYESDIVRLSEW